MKKLLAALSLMALAATPVLAGTLPGSGVVGSLHDMNTIDGLTDDAQLRVCAFCHTPHHALTDPQGDLQPLWSHNFTAIADNYVAYQSPTLQANIVDPLMGPSRLCMSCHDGVIAADQHYGGTQNGTNARLASDAWGGAAIGLLDGSGNANFGNDHPIGFSYTDAQTNDVGDGLFAAAGRAFLNNATGLTIEDVLLDGEFMTCATCHEVHNKDNVESSTAVNYFVYAPQDNSALCLTCHDKGNGTNELP